MSTLVIVESPAKARTIQKFLGRGYKVVATYGHIRDLPKKNGSVDPDQAFTMHYEVPKTSGKRVDDLAKAVQGSKTLLLATDPDREGEAISWHVCEALRERELLEGREVKRVVFHEITPRAIQESLAHARDIDMNLVNAQQARRALDYLVGFNLSPLLWKKVRRGLSAGRVQSVALRLVCEREEEIRAFTSREYWSILVDALKAPVGRRKPAHVEARLVVAEGRKLDKFDIPDAATAQRLVAAMTGQPLFVSEIEKKQVQRHPAPPFITSTLQQEASRKLGYSTKKTMSLAQQLYEGQTIPTADGGQEEVGLITYMRTDSVHLAPEALAALREVVVSRYGEAFVPKTPRQYKSSAKNAQEAHEAIRPTDPHHTPDRVREALSPDLYKLYELVWKRTMASQMASARIDQVVVTLAVGQEDIKAPFRLRATGSSVAFPGFLEVYSEGRDEVSLQDRNDDEAETMLPPMEKGERLESHAIKPNQHFTEPPPRFTEATLVKALESFGIGRPSTYSPTMSTLQERGYVRLEQRKFFPEDVGMVVNTFLVSHFDKYVDYHFTAHLEDDLDAVSRGEREWVPLLAEFWQPFTSQVQEKEQSTNKSDITSEATDEVCPLCGKPVVIRLGRFGRFKACTGYPECRHTEDLRKEEGGTRDAAPAAEPQLSDQVCDKCGQPMLIKDGRFGKYLACSGYPACRNIQPLQKPKVIDVTCPQCGKGNFVEKRSRRNKVFYSCSNYPKCKNALWDKPVARPCPQCGAPFLTEKSSRKSGTALHCVAEGCGFKETVESSGDA